VLHPDLGTVHGGPEGFQIMTDKQPAVIDRLDDMSPLGLDKDTLTGRPVDLGLLRGREYTRRKK